MKLILAALSMMGLLLLGSPVLAEWTKSDIALQLTYAAVQGADYAQTVWIARNPSRMNETNPVLGSHPSVDQVRIWMLSTFLLHTAVAALLDKDVWGVEDEKGVLKELRTILQGAGIGLELGFVAKNASMGIKMSF